jgi:hypothetical protein
VSAGKHNFTMKHQMAEILRMQDQVQAVSSKNQTLREEASRREVQVQESLVQVIARREQEMKESLVQQQKAMREEMARLSAASSFGRVSGYGGGGGGGGGGVGTESVLVSKWAPDSFSGKLEDWNHWSTKFRSYVGAMKPGQVGKWMDWAKGHRDTDCKSTALEPAAGACARAVYSALIATCVGEAVKIVENAGEGEGLEA